MRAHFLLLVVACSLPALLAFVIRVPHIERPGYDVLLARETPTAEDNNASNATVTDAPRNATRTDNATTTSATTVPSLNTSDPELEHEANVTAPGELPLKPAVTPALGVGGFILLATGAVLALIGVRNLWVHVFLSSAFLTSLGVTVLIIYVMNPPVRVAIQGAYLVAIFFTGITFGALAIVFKELAEGLGCLLGGFCTSMWLLSTRPGGLLQETDAKAGFIGALSVAFYAVSFSHYTRPYGLIVATSIAGGTAFSLGIDCYSKAGLKEFWLYLWALNDDIFPLGTDTYPVTRYIKVELAVTVIVAIMGVISQLRLWKVVRERRAKEEEKRQEEQRQKDEAEAEVTRRLEAENLKERLEWEAKYGDHEASESSSSIPELAAGSQACRTDDGTAKEKDDASENKSLSDSAISYRCSDCRARGDDALSDMTGDTRSCSETARHDTDDTNENRHADPDTEKLDEGYPAPNPLRAAAVADDRRSDMTAVVGSETVSVYSKRLSMLSRGVSIRSAKSAVKPVTESQEALITHDDDGTSTTRGIAEDADDGITDCDTISVGSHYQAMVDEQRPATQEKPATTDATQLDAGSADQQDRQGGSGLKDAQMEAPSLVVKDQSQKATRDVMVEDSVPMSEDGHSEKTAVDKLVSQLEEAQEGPSKVPQSGGLSVSAAPTTDLEVRNEAEQRGDTAAEITRPQQSKSTTDPTDTDEPSVTKPAKEDRDGEGKAQEKDKDDQRLDTEPVTNVPDETPAKEDNRSSKALSSKEESRTSEKSQKRKKEPERLDAGTVDRIPKHTSRIVQAYRMNEWAKHLADADAPEPEPIHSFEDERPNPAKDEETAAPVNVPELLQTPLNAQPPPAIENRASLTNDVNNIYHPHGTRIGSQKKKRRSKSPRRLSGNSVGSAQNFSQVLPPAVQPQLQLGNIATQSSAIPLSPVEHSREEAEKAKPRWKGPAPLIAVREDMMRSRLSSVSLPTDAHTRHSAGQTLDNMVRPSSTFPIAELAEEEDDDIPLSQRRTMLHQQSSPIAPTNASTAAPPRRNNSGAPSKANSPAVLAAWRESVREDLKDRRDPLNLARAQSTIQTPGDRSASPLAFNQLGQRNVSSPSAMIGDKIAEGMQRGDMSDLHREAMRRMQAQANRSVNQLI